MPYDYYEILKEETSSDEYTETSDLVRKHLWNETINFKQSQDWLSSEEKILIKLFRMLRYI